MKKRALAFSLLFLSYNIYGGHKIPPAKYMSSDALPLQIVYRFDDHRYIILTGEKRHYDGVDYCSGQYWYTDTQKIYFPVLAIRVTTNGFRNPLVHVLQSLPHMTVHFLKI